MSAEFLYSRTSLTNNENHSNTAQSCKSAGLFGSGSDSGVEVEGSGVRHWPPRLVSKCRNFGQFHIIWAILYQNFWQFHNFWASLRQNFGQFNIHQTVSISVETLFFFFLEGHLNWDRKTDRFSGKIDSMSFFGQMFGALLNPFELLRPWVRAEFGPKVDEISDSIQA